MKTFLRITKEQGLYLDYLCFATLAYTGMRLGEMLALKWTDLDFTKKTIRITKTYYNPNNKSIGYQLLTLKTKKSIRTIVIDDGLVALFKAHKREQMKLKMKQRLIYENQDFIFAENICHPRVMKHLDVDKHIPPHSFRHTHTSLLIEAGAGVKEIQERLGHSDINATMNIYAHMTKNPEEKTSHKFSELTKRSPLIGEVKLFQKTES
ncbi:site-specific integrase [Peribacillus frigoritolerans]|uniref:site-specific integrase n=1 Tax=Peribacillus frigoritolerans TaxID=450367 RepID=UPI002163AA87|nr:site-specific integrase [Peribacillus frigoritolerans]